MNSVELRKHLLEQLQNDKKNENKFMNAFKNKLSEAQNSINALMAENQPLIKLNANTPNNTDSNINIQLIEAFYPYIKDYAKIDTVFSDPDITEEFKKAILYNFKTQVEPRLENIKNKSISVDEFQNFLKNLAKDLLANEAVFTTAKNSTASSILNNVIKTPDEKQAFVELAIESLVKDNNRKITESTYNLEGNLQTLSRDKTIDLFTALAKIDRNCTSFYIATQQQYPDDKDRFKTQNGYLSDTLITSMKTYLTAKTRNVATIKSIYKHYLDEVKTYDKQSSLNAVDIYSNIKKVYTIREKTIDPSDLSGKNPATAATVSTATASALPSVPQTPSTPSEFSTPASTPASYAGIIASPPPASRTRNKTGSGIEVKHQNVNGKYYIDRSKLKKNVLEIRYVKNRHLIPVKPHVISAKFRNIIENHLQGEFKASDTYDLTAKEKHLLVMVAPYLNINKDDLDENNEYHDRFEVIRGSILAGNNNESIKKEARKYLLHAYQTGQINRMTYTTMIEELDL